jgi:phage tail sheath protein FI
VLSTGTDDRASVTDNDYFNALKLFTKDLGDGAVAIPGEDIAVHTQLLAHGQQFNRVALLSHTQTATISDLTDASSAIGAYGEYGGLFAPWVQISDNANGHISVPPEGYVAAVRARAHAQVGPWRAPAGQVSVAATLTGLEDYYDDDEGNSLDDAHVNVIRKIANTLRLYGWRSLSTDEDNYKFLNARDVMNRVSVEAANRLEKYVFGTIDQKGHLLSSVHAECIGVVSPMAAAGGLYPLTDSTGQQVDPGYKVVTDNSVNTPTTLANNEIHAIIGLRLSPTGAWIYVTVLKVGLLSGL